MSESILPPRKAVLTPTLDVLFVGGLSIVVLVAMIALPLPGLQALATLDIQQKLMVVLVLGTLINSPHFVASWFLLYGSTETRTRHRWAAYGVPAALVAYCAFAFAVGDRDPRPTYWLLGVASLYLAWHYTGQAWGMIATFSHLEGTIPTDRERLLLRGSLRAMLAWHVVWALHWAIDLPEPWESWLATAYDVMGPVVAIAIVVGMVGFGMMRARIGRWIPSRVLVPWVAIAIWYSFLSRYPAGGLFWVQIFHSLQYLAFPLRVESNRWQARELAATTGDARPPRLGRSVHMVAFIAVVVAVGWLVFEGSAAMGAALADHAFAGRYPPGLLGTLVAGAVNIHHYFTDGVVWKIRNPAVRRELFAHLSR